MTSDQKTCAELAIRHQLQAREYARWQSRYRDAGDIFLATMRQQSAEGAAEAAMYWLQRACNA
jgi:hypothetical protein